MENDVDNLEMLMFSEDEHASDSIGEQRDTVSDTDQPRETESKSDIPASSPITKKRKVFI